LPECENTLGEERAPVITILVPVYNVQQYLRECLDSLLAQTFADFEVICINDGSTDSSRQIIGEYLLKDPRFQVIDKENSGYGASMNVGLAAARGEYLGILESDDFIDPETIETLYQAARHYDAQVVKANCWFYWSQPSKKDELFWLVPEDQVNRLVNTQKEHDIFYLKPSIWSALYKRDFLAENDVRFLETPGASFQDSGFNFRVWASSERTVFLREAFLHYRQDNEGSSVNSATKAFCVCDEYDGMERYLSQRPALEPKLRPVMAKMRFDSYMWNYERLSAELQMPFLERFRADFLAEQTTGNINLELFEPWKVSELKTIIKSPQRFHAERLAANYSTPLGKAAHYFRLGGLPLLWQLTKSKILRRH